MDLLILNFEKDGFLDTKIRHAGIWLDKQTLHVFYSREGDTPERILQTSIN
tara:strand:- start:917 stop:1069 length:153 start_codon:yes stop_codon:yes gene_type:complete